MIIRFAIVELICEVRRQRMIANTKKVCCNCGHDIRTESKGHIECHCELDGSYIGYARCMEGSCEHWIPDKFSKHPFDGYETPEGGAVT